MASAGLLAAVHRQPCDLSVCASCWRAARRSGVSVAGQSAVSDRKSSCRPRIFRGQWFCSAGIPTVCFPGVRRTAKPVTAGIYGETARSNCRGWRSTGGGASGAGIAGFRAAGGGTGAPPLRGASGAVAARLAAEYRPVPNSAKRSAAGVERVLGDAAVRPCRGKPLVYRHAGEGWSPCAAEGTSAPVGCRVAAGGQPRLTPASDAVAGEHSVLGRKRSVPAIPRPAGGTSSAEPVCRGHLPDTGSGGGE